MYWESDSELLFEASYFIAKEWFTRGKDEKKIVFKFVSYWISFNQLYNYYSSPEIKDWDKIEPLLDDNVDIFTSCINFSDKSMAVFYDAPVLEAGYRAPNLDWSHYSVHLVDAMYEVLGDNYSYSECKAIAKRHIRFCDNNTLSLIRIKQLFRYIYRIRCNLFHGNKTQSVDRDLRLIESSTRILEDCLPMLMERIYRRKV